MKSLFEKVEEYGRKLYENEKGKWEAGLKNNYYLYDEQFAKLMRLFEESKATEKQEEEKRKKQNEENRKISEEERELKERMAEIWGALFGTDDFEK